MVMEKDNPGISEFGYIHRAFLVSTDEAALDAAWQTVIFTVPAGHKELPMLHQAAKLRQSELRQQAAKEKAEAEKNKNKPLIVKDGSRGDNERYYGKR
jgi:hypothetical protein